MVMLTKFDGIGTKRGIDVNANLSTSLWINLFLYILLLAYSNVSILQSFDVHTQNEAYSIHTVVNSINIHLRIQTALF